MRYLLALVAFALLSSAPLASAQATRTWVSGVGDDANPCSRTAPCKTFAGAISKTATAGEIDVLDPGGFGAVTITKSITIDGGGFTAGVLVSGTNGIVVNAAGGTVTLRNLDMDGLGTGLSGVLLINAAALHLENLVIYEFGASGLSAVSLVAPSGTTTDVSMRNVRISNCATNAVVPTPPATSGGIIIGASPAAGTMHVTLDRVQVNGCGTGLLMLDGSTVFARDSDFSHNANAGISLAPTGTAATLTLDHGMATQNGTGVSADSAFATVRLSDTSVLDNTTGLAATNSAAIISFNNNRLKGNGTDGAPTLNIYQH